AGGPAARRRRPRAQVVGPPSDPTAAARARLLDQLVGARLLSAERDHVEIIHESLLTNWGRLREATEAARPMLQQRTRFQQASEVWLAQGRAEAALLSGGRLAEARALSIRQDVAFRVPTAREFLERSLALQPTAPPCADLELSLRPDGRDGYAAEVRFRPTP